MSTKFSIKAILSLAAGILVSGAVITQIPALCADHLDRPYDWNLNIETSKLEHQFEYAGSQLQNVVETKTDYYYSGSQPVDDRHPDEDHKIKYQNLWYCNTRPLGLERMHAFDLDQGDGVAIRVKHKVGDGSEREYKAAADSILRVMLDSLVNKNPVVIVYLPDGAPYDEIIQALRNKGALDAPPHSEDNPLMSSAVNIFIKESTGSRHTTMYYPS